MFKKRPFPYLITALLIALFIFLRVYRIQSSLLFFNDIGRDFLVLFNWSKTSKPPLLGPQTSALPFNQSAFYFYFLYPFYLITGHSPYASLIALISFYITTLILGLILLKKDPKLQKSLLLVFFLISIHPEYIKQARFTWNPSFVTPFILSAFYSFIYLLRQFKKNKKLDWRLIFVFALSISAATAFSYSTVPLFLAFCLLIIFYFKKEIWKLLIALTSSLAFWNLGTIAFELRHRFPLSQMLFNRQETSQLSSNFLSKLNNLNRYTLGMGATWALVFLLLLVFVVAYSLKQRKEKEELKITGLLLLIALSISLIVPIKIHSHYVFAFLSLLFLMISFLEKKLSMLIVIILLPLWFNRQQLAAYFQPAIRTIKESQLCAENFCSKHQEPLFVSGQSSYLPSHHNAMEWQYFLSEAGCDIKDLTTQPKDAESMAVVIDDSSYEHGKTQFNELSLFGPSQEFAIYACSEQLKIHYLQRVY